VLNGVWVANSVAFNGAASRELAAQFMSLAEKQGATVPLMIGHRLMGFSMTFTGDIAQGLAHFDRAIALYDPAEHRPLSTRFGQDIRVSVLSYRSWALWVLGYPEAALADTEKALKDAREIGQATTLMLALNCLSLTHLLCGNYATANVLADELAVLADEKGALYWKALALSRRIKILTAADIAVRSTGATIGIPTLISRFARAYAAVGQFDDAWRCIGEAMTAVETTKEKWGEADIHRAAGEIELLSPERDAARAEAHFTHALEIARGQQAKSWELRAAMSMARLWRDQGKRAEAHDLLAPVYGWFTEGFDTLDLKEAKTLLDALAS
jgi:predicted ATPase